MASKIHAHFIPLFTKIQKTIADKDPNNKIHLSLSCSDSKTVISFFWNRTGNSIFYEDAKSFYGNSSDFTVELTQEIFDFIEKLVSELYK